jgi:hypothetical protein
MIVGKMMCEGSEVVLKDGIERLVNHYRGKDEPQSAWHGVRPQPKGVRFVNNFRESG